MPARLRDLARELKAFGVTIEEGGGKHTYRATAPGFRSYPVPAHKGMKSEIVDEYIRGICRHFALDAAALWAALRGEQRRPTADQTAAARNPGPKK